MSNVSYIFGNDAPAGIQIINREYAWGKGYLYRRNEGDLFFGCCSLPFQEEGFRALVGTDGSLRFMSDDALCSMARFEPYRWFEYDAGRNCFAVRRVTLFDLDEATAAARPAAPLMDRLGEYQRLNCQLAENLRLAASVQELSGALLLELMAAHAEMKGRLERVAHLDLHLREPALHRESARELRREMNQLLHGTDEPAYRGLTLAESADIYAGIVRLRPLEPA